MQPDRERIEEVLAWLSKASDDIRACSKLLAGDDPMCDAAVFHSQQAAEKAIKGFLVWHDRPFGKTHNLVELGKKASSVDESLEELLRRASPLSQYAWRFRYPGEPEEASADEAAEALALCGEVFEAILGRLPEVKSLHEQRLP